MQRRLTLLWVKGAVKTLQGPWNGARLVVVDRADMPEFPKAKIPPVVKPELAPTALAEAKHGRADQRLDGATCAKTGPQQRRTALHPLN